MRSPIPLRPTPQVQSDAVARAAFAAFSAIARNRDVASEASRLWPDDEVTAAIIARASAPVGTTATGGWAAELIRPAMGEFLRDVAPASAAAALIRLGTITAFPPGAAAADTPLLFPQRTGAPAARPIVAEGAPIPVSSYVFATITIAPQKLGVIVVASRELARRADASAIFQELLVADAAASLDTLYFSTSAPGLLNGVTATPQTGSMAGDLHDLAAIVGAGGSGRAVFVVGPGMAAAAALRADVTATVLPSSVVAEGTIIACDPAGLVHAFGSEPDIFASEDSTIHMSDVPLPIVAGVTGDPIRGMYQTGGIATRLLLDIGFIKRRTNAVAFMTGSYGW